MDVTNILPNIFVKALINAGTKEQRQLLENPLLANATQPYEDALIHVVQYNLEVIETLSKAEPGKKCIAQPILQCRKIMEAARDSGFICMQKLQRDLHAVDDYHTCLDNVIKSSKSKILMFQMSVNSCVWDTVDVTEAIKNV